MSFELKTARLMLVSTPFEVIQTRLEQACFSAIMTVDNQNLLVSFPHEWPGDALKIFPKMLENLQLNPEKSEWGGIMIEMQSSTAVGQLSCKGKPNANGIIEIGYGVSPAFQGKGYATELVSAFTQWLLEQETVTCVIAETIVNNLASQRVLEKSGFVQIDTRLNAADGALIVWSRVSK